MVRRLDSAAKRCSWSATPTSYNRGRRQPKLLYASSAPSATGDDTRRSTREDHLDFHACRQGDTHTHRRILRWSLCQHRRASVYMTKGNLSTTRRFRSTQKQKARGKKKRVTRLKEHEKRRRSPKSKCCGAGMRTVYFQSLHWGSPTRRRLAKQRLAQTRDRR